jgi:hypothetical protein
VPSNAAIRFYDIVVEVEGAEKDTVCENSIGKRRSPSCADDRTLRVATHARDCIKDCLTGPAGEPREAAPDRVKEQKLAPAEGRLGNILNSN